MLTLLGGASLLAAGPAMAKVETGPISVGEGVTLDPMLDARLRYERVDQDDMNLDADALTLRVRPGLELAFDDGLSFLVEGEATLAVVHDYNSTTNGKAGLYSVVADPQNIEINRAQMMYKRGGSSLTVGRQRIVLDDSRWVGNVGWRQNEQTFDAVRIVAAPLKPLVIDATYAISQRSIFGIDSGGRQAMSGNFYFASAGAKVAGVDVKAFAYLLDYDQKEVINPQLRDSKTLGLIANGAIPLGDKFALNFKASYAVQKDWRDEPANYSVDYIAGELGASFWGFGVTAGYEELGADNNGNRVQTPMATLHKFNGWADTFLITPPGGIKDYYVTVGKKLPGVKLLPGLNASVTYHEFDSEEGRLDYGSEWDALIGFKFRGVGVLAKYANYDAKAFGTDTEKLWIELNYSF